MLCYTWMFSERPRVALGRVSHAWQSSVKFAVRPRSSGRIAQPRQQRPGAPVRAEPPDASAPSSTAASAASASAPAASGRTRSPRPPRPAARLTPCDAVSTTEAPGRDRPVQPGDPRGRFSVRLRSDSARPGHRHARRRRHRRPDASRAQEPRRHPARRRRVLRPRRQDDRLSGGHGRVRGDERDLRDVLPRARARRARPFRPRALPRDVKVEIDLIAYIGDR